MKKQYQEPTTEIIRYPDEDVILTSTHHHCGTGIVTDHYYGDTTGDTYCDTDNGKSCTGDYICDVHQTGCSDCDEYSECDVYGTENCDSNVESSCEDKEGT